MNSHNPWYGAPAQAVAESEAKKKVTIIEDFQSASSGSTGGLYPKVPAVRPPKPKQKVDDQPAPQQANAFESEGAQERAHEPCKDEGLLPCFGPMPGHPEEEAQQVQQRAHLNQEAADIHAGLLKAAQRRARRISSHIWDDVGREAMQVATEYSNICKRIMAK